MFRERVIESCVDEEVAGAWMAHPMNRNGQISRRMIALGLFGTLRIQIQTSIHVDHAGLKGDYMNSAGMSQHVGPVRESGVGNAIGRYLKSTESTAQEIDA